MKKVSTKTTGKKPQVLSSQIVYAGKVLGIRRDEVIEPSGVRTTREMITHPGSVVVLPVLADGRVLLIQQYRYAARQYLWELVAGRMDPGETPIEGAARELKEETGLSNWRRCFGRGNCGTRKQSRESCIICGFFRVKRSSQGTVHS